MLFPGKTSVDVIFGRPGQSDSKWIEELNQVSHYAHKILIRV